MKAIAFDLLPSGLFSIRQPPSFQSAIVYPLPPPSTIKGLLANALQQSEGIPPLQALEKVESRTSTCCASANTSIAVSSGTVRLRIYERQTWRSDALPRQFAHTRNIRCLVISKDVAFLEMLEKALTRSILYLGDSESLVAVSDLWVNELTETPLAKGTVVETGFYAPINLFDDLQGDSISYWVFEETLRHERLTMYVFPIRVVGGHFEPSLIRGRVREGARALSVDGNTVLLPAGPEAAEA